MRAGGKGLLRLPRDWPVLNGPPAGAFRVGPNARLGAAGALRRGAEGGSDQAGPVPDGGGPGRASGRGRVGGAQAKARLVVAPESDSAESNMIC